MNRNIRILSWFNFFCDFKLYAPVAILYFSGITGSFALGMSIFSVVTVAGALSEIPTGIFSDRIGRRNTVILGALCAVFYTTLYAAAVSYTVLILGAILEGVSRSFYSGNNDAFLHDTLKETGSEKEYGTHLGKVSAMFQLALAVSAVAGGILAGISYPLIMWLSVIPQAICLLMAFFLTEPRIPKQESANTYEHLKEAAALFFRNKKLQILSISSVSVYGMGEAGYQFQSAFYNTLIPVWAIGFVKAISNTGATVSFYYSGKLLKKFGVKQILYFELFYNRTVNTIAALFPTAVSPFLTSTSSVLYGASSIALNSLMQKEYADEQRATLASLQSFAGSIFFAVIAFFLGLVADRTSVITAFLILQVFQSMNYFIYRRMFRLLSL